MGIIQQAISFFTLPKFYWLQRQRKLALVIGQWHYEVNSWTSADQIVKPIFLRETKFFLRFRVRLFMDVFKLLDGIVGVYLSGCKAAVAKQLFYGIQVSTVVH